jgi:DNA-binding PadR family transcriptional regulator
MRHHHHTHDFDHFFGRHRHRGGPGFGRFGGWFADGGELGGRGFGMGRKMGSPDLQLLILALLADKPRHGYEVIKSIEELSKGFYAPSPGMVYPALTYLEEIGHATVASEGSRKLYQITDQGREYLEERREESDALLAQFSRVGERMEHLRRAMRAHEGDEDGDDERRGGKSLKRAQRVGKEFLGPLVAVESDQVAAGRSARDIRR